MLLVAFAYRLSPLAHLNHGLDLFTNYLSEQWQALCLHNTIRFYLSFSYQDLQSFTFSTRISFPQRTVLDAFYLLSYARAISHYIS